MAVHPPCQEEAAAPEWPTHGRGVPRDRGGTDALAGISTPPCAGPTMVLPYLIALPVARRALLPAPEPFCTDFRSEIDQAEILNVLVARAVRKADAIARVDNCVTLVDLLPSAARALHTCARRGPSPTLCMVVCMHAQLHGRRPSLCRTGQEIVSRLSASTRRRATTCPSTGTRIASVRLARKCDRANRTMGSRKPKPTTPANCPQFGHNSEFSSDFP